MLQAFRLQQGDATLSYPQMKAALGEPVSSVPANREHAAASGAWWLRSVVSTGDKGRSAVEATFASLAAGRKAGEARDSERFTEFDGHVPDAGKVLDPAGADRSFSVTELEGAAGCPFRFFLKRAASIRTPSPSSASTPTGPGTRPPSCRTSRRRRTASCTSPPPGPANCSSSAARRTARATPRGAS